MLNAIDLLMTPFAWEALKRTLRTREIRIENLGEHHADSRRSAPPKPIPFDAKVMLIGPPIIYYLLYVFDEEFGFLFWRRKAAPA